MIFISRLLQAEFGVCVFPYTGITSISRAILIPWVKRELQVSMVTEIFVAAYPEMVPVNHIFRDNFS